MKHKSNITYQNKDIVSKVFAEKFKGKSLKVYGIDLPDIVEVLPTNLPAVSANELRIDNIFRLADGSLAILDYESMYRERNKIKYTKYVQRIWERYAKEMGSDLKIWMIVIYTADTKPGTTKAVLDMGSLKLVVQEAFLSQLNTDVLRRELEQKIRSGQTLSEEDMMRFIIFPLTAEGREAKNTCIREAFEWTKSISDEEVVTFLLAGMLVFADKVIDQTIAEQIKGWIHMTKVGKLFEEEKMEAVREAVREATKEATKDSERKMALKLLQKGIDIAVIAETMELLTLEDIQTLK